MKTLLIVAFSLFSIAIHAQDSRLEFEPVSTELFKPSKYELDTGTSAVVLREFCKTRIISEGENRLVTDYHVRLRILRPEGLRHANFRIALRKNERNKETVENIRASSFELVDGVVRETQLTNDNIFSQDGGEYTDVVSFAVPNVKVGSVVEVRYTKTSPFHYKFHGWEIQSGIPKLVSEYHAVIPANYVYHITLKGYLTFEENTSEIVRDCFTRAEDTRVDCALYKWRMKDIPAFKRERFMKATSDYIAYLDFELSHIKYLDGTVKHITREWEDAARELDEHSMFGAQWRRGKDLFGRYDLLALKESEPDEAVRVGKVFEMVRNHFTWNGEKRMFSIDGVKKAFEKRLGSSADINLSLIGALTLAGIDVDPVILSTRDHGIPVELYPVLTDYNYVIARARIGDKHILLDATNDQLAMGILPERCLNGKGRVLSKKGSFFIDLLPLEKSKKQSICNLTLTADGKLKGTVQTLHQGYAAAHIREQIALDSVGYRKNLMKRHESIIPSSHRFIDAENINKPLKEMFSLKATARSLAGNILINPFMFDEFSLSPFNAETRIYPVDLDVPFEENIAISLEFPPDMKPDGLPEPVKILLPDNGGKLLYEVTQLPERLLVNISVQLNKTSYNAREYPVLRELFARVFHITNNTDLLLKKTL